MIAEPGDVRAILDLETVDDLTYRGLGSGMSEFGLYGGHLLGQGLVAASRTVDDERVVNSVHALFLRGGDAMGDVEYRVEIVRDGRAFCTRRAVAWQNDKPIFEATVSFHTPEDSDHEVADEMPADVPAPLDSPSWDDLIAEHGNVFGEQWSNWPKGFEVRIVNSSWVESGPSRGGGIDYWCRVDPASVPNEPRIEAAALAFVSDDSLADNTMVPFGRYWGTDEVVLASLDHSMWFHRKIDLDQWIFVQQRPVSLSSNRGLSELRMWSESGELLASASQEALTRF